MLMSHLAGPYVVFKVMSWTGHVASSVVDGQGLIPSSMKQTFNQAMGNKGGNPRSQGLVDSGDKGRQSNDKCFFFFPLLIGEMGRCMDGWVPFTAFLGKLDHRISRLLRSNP
jgi:hypothetical protein